MLEQVDRLPAWWLAAAYVALWVLVGILVSLVLGRSLRRMPVSRVPVPHVTELSEVIVKSVPRPAGVAVFLMGIAAGLRFMPIEEQRMTALHRLLALALGIVGVAVLMRLAFRSIDAYGRSNPQLRSSAGIGRAVTWIVGLVLVSVLVSDAFGISLAPALTALGVGSLAVALALQDTLSNFFAGLHLVIEKPVRPGDYIRMEPTYEGFVESIGWRSTNLRTLAENLVVIPNAALAKAVVTNFTRPSPHIATGVRVDVSADSDVAKVQAALEDEARRSLDVPGVLPTPAPGVTLSPGFVDGGIAFTLSFAVKSIEEQGPAQHVVRTRIAIRLRKDGIALRRAA